MGASCKAQDDDIFQPRQAETVDICGPCPVTKIVWLVVTGTMEFYDFPIILGSS